ncbi:aspartate--tRNA ligase 1, cytoplasmic-like [Papaver somniferum]|uniref:aspartate--tRNA ligase 1, cytoplasmic-like n=1 Tax=Papaver somniferum TaxID=3469 RepID=UPI000E6F798F|nr:aspartate--tRNA ligase 1, cytoplasmic-like [Papaver somniferum]
MGILIVRENLSTIQCVINVEENLISRKTVKFATSLSKESHVNIQGIVSLPDTPIHRITQQVSRKYLSSKGFLEMHNPKLLESSGEAAASLFRFDDKDLPTFLTQSPHFRRHLKICDDFQRVFEIGSVLRDSFPPGHLNELVGLDVEMEIKENHCELTPLLRINYTVGAPLYIFNGIHMKYCENVSEEARSYFKEAAQNLGEATKCLGKERKYSSGFS